MYVRMVVTFVCVRVSTYARICACLCFVIVCIWCSACKKFVHVMYACDVMWCDVCNVMYVTRCMHACVCHVCVCLRASMQCMYVCMYVCLCACMYACNVWM